MAIFFLIVASVVYFNYRWYTTIQKVNKIVRYTNEGMAPNSSIITNKASLGQPCVLQTNNVGIPGSNLPICDNSYGLECVTGLFKGNGEGTGTGVCLSGIGHYCDTIYDCVPSAHACINNLCENINETINMPCKFDSDCIGDYNAVTGAFQYNHICDNGFCKYNLSPKDQGCTTDLDCVQPEGGAICYKGSFLTNSNPDGILVQPSYKVSSVTGVVANTVTVGLIKIDFGDSLLTVNSFEIGTEVNFVKEQNSLTTTISHGPYYVKDVFNNNRLILSSSKYQPDPAEYANVPNSQIKLNQEEYVSGTTVPYTELSGFVGYYLVFGILPPLNISSVCYWDSDNANFSLVLPNTLKLVNNENVVINTTEVRFNITTEGNDISNINTAPAFTLNGLPSDSSFTVTGNVDHLKGFTDPNSPLKVMFGKPSIPDLLNSNKGVCVMKLPPSASVNLDSKYDLTDYEGNPCISLFANSTSVGPVNGYCQFINGTPGGVGNVCQFKRGTTDPLPCSNASITYEGLDYTLECLIGDDLTETIRNNQNFLNPAFGGICAYPVHDKFKSCDTYGRSCAPPYVCTGYEGGSFCDSRFDLLECNTNYRCPPSFACIDGKCLSSSGGYCIGNGTLDCVSGTCEGTLHLAYYDAVLDQDTDATNKLVEVMDLGLTFTGNSTNIKLQLKSVYNTGTLVTYVLIDDGTNKLVKELRNNEFSTNITFTNNGGNHILRRNVNTIEVKEWSVTGTALTVDSVTYTLETNDDIVDVNYDEDIVDVVVSNTVTRPVFGTRETYIYKRYNNTGGNPIMKYVLPYNKDSSGNIVECKNSMLKSNDREIDIVCVEHSSNVLGTRYKSREFDNTNEYYTSLLAQNPGNCPNGDLGCFVNPVITSLKLDTGNRYEVSSSNDIKTLFAFSGSQIFIDNVIVNNIEEIDGKIYVNMASTLTLGGSLSVTVNSGNQTHRPFSFDSTSVLTNYGDAISNYLVYPNWINDLEDLIVGDNYTPNVKRVMYEPNRTTRNYYAIVNMYTGYTDPIENSLVSQNVTDENTYLFRFSALNNELGLTVNETLPIKIHGPTDINRFAQCNETGNLFFITKKCR